MDPVIMCLQSTIVGWYEAVRHEKRNAGGPLGWSELAGACGSADLHVESFVPESACSSPATHPRTQDKVDTAMHWQPNVERRSQTKLFCATFSSFTLTSMQELVFMRRSNSQTKTTVNIWHNWVWTVSSGHERVAWGRDGERHTRGGQWWIV